MDGSTRGTIAATLVVLGLLGGAAPAAAVPTGPPVQVATGLNTPWELAVAPDGRTFVTERPGRIRVLDAADRLLPGTVLTGADVAAGVRKFLGLALHPDFATNRLAYLYVTRDVGGTPRSGIVRLREDGGRFVVERFVFDGIGSDLNHDGGRMVVGPDRALYVTTGDVHDPARPQDRQSLNGKVLRFAVTGTEAELGVPADNPFVAEGGNARFVWSYGHRHPQGLAFDAAGRLWETEHGPSGEGYDPALYPGGAGRSSRDELNVIVRGGNFGWPVISGTDQRAGMITPVATSGTAPAWAPGDLAVGGDGLLYAPFLAGQRLERFDPNGATVGGQASHLRGELGRLRVAVARGTDLLIAQDGATAGVYRMALTPPPAAPPATPGPSPAPGSGPTAPPATSPPPAGAGAGGTGTSATAGASTRVRVLAARLRAALRGPGLRRLRAGRSVAARAGGFTPGRLTVQLRRGTSRGRVVASASVVVRSRATLTVRLRAGRVGRTRLRGARRLVVRVTHRPTGGPASSTALALSPPRR